MNTQEILSIIALSLFGLCFLCGLAKMAMKKDSDKKNCDKACSMAIFAAVVLVGVSQLLTETEKYGDGQIARCCCDPFTYQCAPGAPPCNDSSPCGNNMSCEKTCTDQGIPRCGEPCPK